MLDWAVPWTTDQIIDTAFLVVCCVVVTSVPLIYLRRANLRDPFARAILAGTGVTALAFNISLVFTVAIHAGWHPTEDTGHWIARGLYTAVAIGKGLFLLALIKVLRSDAHRAYRTRQQGQRMMEAEYE